MRAVRLTEALDVCGADELQLLRDVARDVDQPLVANRHALDRLAPFRLDHRARDRIQTAAVEIAEDVDRELLAREADLHDRVDRRVAEEEPELRPVIRAIDVTGAEALPGLHEQRKRRVVGNGVRKPGRRRVDAAFLEKNVRQVLVPEPRDDLRVGQQEERAELVPRLGEHHVVEVGQRDDDADVVLLHEPAQRRQIVVVFDPGHKCPVLRGVQRGSQCVDVRGNGRGACAVECVDDVDTLSCAREEDGGHGGQYTRKGNATSAEAAKTPATAIRKRPGMRSSPYPNVSAQAGAVVSM